jgi:hypothetical protein
VEHFRAQPAKVAKAYPGKLIWRPLRSLRATESSVILSRQAREARQEKSFSQLSALHSQLSSIENFEHLFLTSA